MRMRAKNFLTAVLHAAITIAGLGALLMPTPVAAQTACPPTINSCGCAITAAGNYKIGLNINASQGLTSVGACVEIDTSFVILDGGKKSITVAGGNSRAGIGILVRHGVRTSFIEGRGSPGSGWGKGLLIEGSNLVVDKFAANLHATAR